MEERTTYAIPLGETKTPDGEETGGKKSDDEKSDGNKTDGNKTDGKKDDGKIVPIPLIQNGKPHADVTGWPLAFPCKVGARPGARADPGPAVTLCSGRR